MKEEVKEEVDPKQEVTSVIGPKIQSFIENKIKLFTSMSSAMMKRRIKKSIMPVEAIETTKAEEGKEEEKQDPRGARLNSKVSRKSSIEEIKPVVKEEDKLRSSQSSPALQHFDGALEDTFQRALSNDIPSLGDGP